MYQYPETYQLTETIDEGWKTALGYYNISNNFTSKVQFFGKK